MAPCILCLFSSNLSYVKKKPVRILKSPDLSRALSFWRIITKVLKITLVLSPQSDLKEHGISLKREKKS